MCVHIASPKTANLTTFPIESVLAIVARKEKRFNNKIAHRVSNYNTVQATSNREVSFKSVFNWRTPLPEWSSLENVFCDCKSFIYLFIYLFIRSILKEF